MSAIIVEQGQNIKKKQLLKYPKATPPKKTRNLDQNINDSKSHICNSFFENIFSGVQLYYTRSSGHHQSFFYSRIYSRKSQNQQKPGKKITHFTIQFRLKSLTHFTNLNSFETGNNMLPKQSQKAFSVQKFSSKYVSVWCQEDHLHCTIS